MTLGTMVIGGLIGWFLSSIYTEQIAGQNHGAGRWQRPGNKQFMTNRSSFVRWLSIQGVAIVGGAFLAEPASQMFVTVFSSLDTVPSIGFAAVAVGVLYTAFQKFEL